MTLPVRLTGTERAIGILRRTREHSSPGAQLLIEEIREVSLKAVTTASSRDQRGG